MSRIHVAYATWIRDAVGAMGTSSEAAQGQVAQAIDAPQPGLGPRAVLVQARPKMAVTAW